MPEPDLPRPQSSRETGSPGIPAELSGRAGALVLAAAVAGIALAVYGPALDGPFVSDDLHYVATNPYVHDLNVENLVDVLDPRGTSTVFVVNYAPVQILLHALQWQVFGDDVRGHHTVNVAIHALASLLLGLLLLRTGLAPPFAAAGGLLFLLHPANVEAVAWISQLKTTAAMTLCLGALLAQPRRPWLGATLFGLALLAKGTAAVALPVGLLLAWLHPPPGGQRLGWFAIWAVLLVAYLVPEFATHQRTGAVETPHPDVATWVRSVIAIAMRYLVMAYTSWGVSAFHETPPARSWLDPWWLLAIPVLLGLGARSLVTLLGRRTEAVWWLWAAASFVPISQIFPFRYPMADRYLYFILPGLLGGTLFALQGIYARLPEPRRRLLGPALGLVAAAWAVGFGVHAHERAAIWRSPGTIVFDAARHYPDGISAHLLIAREQARQGDADASIAALRVAADRGFNRYQDLGKDPRLAPLARDPRFQALIHELAGRWIERLAAHPDPTSIELRHLAEAHLARGENEQAILLLERALEQPGPIRDRIEADLRRLRAGAGS